MTTAGVPAHVELLRAFANTVDVETGTDELADPGGLSRWLVERSLVEPGAEPADEELLRTARALRDGLRSAFAAHHQPAAGPDRDAHDPAADPALAAASAAMPLRVDLSGEVPRLAPVLTGAAGGVSRLLVAVAESAADGTWSRLKTCPADTCRWAFYDTSKNRSKTWCDMAVCGNRRKTRAYRARQRADA